MLDCIQTGLGYDHFGNNPDLLAPGDKRNLDRGKFQRASGDAPCTGCGQPYNIHPQVQGALWLRRGCHFLVKL